MNGKNVEVKEAIEELVKKIELKQSCLLMILNKQDPLKAQGS